jgi:hypothetical protein
MTDIATTELTADEARELTAEIRRDLDGLLPKIKRAFEGRADKVLGYGSWQAYCSTELSDVRVPTGDRPAMVAELRHGGMSQRAIGAALGVSKETVRRDLSTATNVAVEEPTKVISLDGRERPATQPNPIPKDETSVPDFTPLDRQLDAEMEGTAQRFRNNFSTIVCRADDLWQFDVDRIAEVYAVDFDQAVRPFLDEMTRWCDRVRSARRDASGLRLVNGASR